MTIWVYGLLGVTQGVLIWVGGPIRWVGDFYTVPRMVPESPYSWAVAVGGSGILVMVGSITRTMWVRNVGLIVFAVWCAAFALTGATSAQLVPTVGTTSPPTYMAVSIAVLILLFLDERRPSHDHRSTPT